MSSKQESTTETERQRYMHGQTGKYSSRVESSVRISLSRKSTFLTCQYMIVHVHANVGHDVSKMSCRH